MSHFSTAVLVPPDTQNVYDKVAELLAPYEEKEEWFEEGSRWDWWTIGGRWMGVLSAAYDPTTDPRNIEVCDLCLGSGERPGGRERFGDKWFASCNGCNGCQGKGTRLKWPTQWVQDVPGNVAPVKDVTALPDIPEFFALVTPDGKWHEQGRMGWWGVTIEDEAGHDEKPEALWGAAFRALLEQHPDALLVVVDCHV